jgi:hypothetical protein
MRLIEVDGDAYEDFAEMAAWVRPLRLAVSMRERMLAVRWALVRFRQPFCPRSAPMRHNWADLDWRIISNRNPLRREDQTENRDTEILS